MAPKRWVRVASGLGGVVGWAMPHSHGVEHWILFVVFASATLLPAYLVEAWWKRRRKREAERIIVLPSSAQITAR